MTPQQVSGHVSALKDQGYVLVSIRFGATVHTLAFATEQHRETFRRSLVEYGKTHNRPANTEILALILSVPHVTHEFPTQSKAQEACQLLESVLGKNGQAGKHQDIVF